MTPLDRRSLERLAELAALELDEAQIPTLLEQLGRILEYAAALGDVEEPGGPRERPWLPEKIPPPRPDLPRPAGAGPLDPGEFAPAFRDGWFVVPKPGGLTDT